MRGADGHQPRGSIILDVTPGTEPSTYVFMGAGLLTLAALRRRRKS